ncbi:zona pellucida sperm-binding protein 3-like [Sphaeramia orbicularis]|uniref:zona pellucida sperm-binding protein 3-like n=1 Tax=Sphaeramia orbicularis TaxID=375764 RepID=UPI00117F0FC5|nr:zona pellucida sperm-binding protein 3-like [Sphaeramia orbicularis]
MKTKWKLYILWSVLTLGLLSAAENTHESSFVLRRKKVSTSGSPKSKHDAVKSTTTGDAKSSQRSAAPPGQYDPPTPVTARTVSPEKPESDTQSDFAYVPDVSVTCGASDVVVRVKPAFYGLGARAGELRLGNTCRSNGVLEPYGDLLFTYPLTACNVRRELSLDYLVYKFVLHYQPSLKRFPSGAHKISVHIECRYQRNHHVHQLAVQPTWKTAVAYKILKGHMNYFQIELMDDTWSGPVKSQVFQLGQTVNLQISAPRLPTGKRLYINSCYAYPSSGSKPTLKFAIIDNYGCLLDSKSDPGASEFISRTDKSLRFSLKAFQFTPDPDSEIRIKCKLFATSADPGPAHKSCTYRHNSWEALSGDNSICDCCDFQCVTSKPRRAMMEGSASGSLLVSNQLHTDDDLQPISPSVVSMREVDETRETHDSELHSHDNQWQSEMEFDKREKEDESGVTEPEMERFEFGDGIIFEESKEFEVKDSNEFGEDGSWYEDDFSGYDKEEEKCNEREDEILDLETVHRNKDGTEFQWLQFEQNPKLEVVLNSEREEEIRENRGGRVKDEGVEVSDVEWESGDGLVDVMDEKETTWYFTWGL